MAMEIDRQEFWRHEADKLALAERLAKRARIAISCSAAIPLAFGFLELGFGQTEKSSPFLIVALTITFAGGFTSMAADGYIKGMKALIERGRGETSSRQG